VNDIDQSLSHNGGSIISYFIHYVTRRKTMCSTRSYYSGIV